VKTLKPVEKRIEWFGVRIEALRERAEAAEAEVGRLRAVVDDRDLRIVSARGRICEAEADQGFSDLLADYNDRLNDIKALRAKLAAAPEDLTRNDAYELQGILRTLTPSGTALKTSARELVRKWEEQNAKLALADKVVAAVWNSKACVRLKSIRAALDAYRNAT